MKQDPYTKDFYKTKVSVWNPTVANLTLMALGSSAPEILLNVIETVSTLGAKPGELGPSTIVGSAAFNFLVISGISIYAVHKDNDERTDEERKASNTVKGIKKVEDTGVFAITTIWSIVAYVWLYVVLLDGVVKEWEAYLTLGFFFALIIMAYIADCLRRKTTQSREDDKFGFKENDVQHEVVDLPQNHINKAQYNNVRCMTVLDFYQKLIPVKSNEDAKSPQEQQANKQIAQEMRDFLQAEFGTSKIEEIDKQALKTKLEGPALIDRINHRKAVAINYKREAIKKYEVMRRENKSANTL